MKLRIKDHRNGYIEGLDPDGDPDDIGSLIVTADRFYKCETNGMCGWVIRNVRTGAYSETYPNKKQAIEIMHEFADDEEEEVR